MNTQLREMIHFAASYGGEPSFVINVIIADTPKKENDPQTDLHSDTFHATAKAWLFLHDVGLDDGAFNYVPKSHILTPERLQWEYEQSLTARSDSRAHHSLGSFRVTHSELERFGYVVKTFSVKANTLVIADTRGFHSRTLSNKHTTRVSLDAYLRRNPFLPWTGIDIFSLPFLKYRSMDMYLAYLDLLEHQLGKKTVWRNVGNTMVEDPVNI